jgi:hypothetical protein
MYPGKILFNQIFAEQRVARSSRNKSAKKIAIRRDEIDEGLAVLQRGYVDQRRIPV